MGAFEDTDRTKLYITQALFLLMETKPYDKITVSEITKKAGVGRATYYRHFGSKSDIISQYFYREIPPVVQLFPFNPQTEDDYYEIIFTVFSKLKEKKKLMQLIQKSGLEYIYLEFLNGTMIKNYIENNRSEQEYSAYYAAGCLFNVSMQWIKKDCRESVKYVADIYFRCLFNTFPALR